MYAYSDTPDAGRIIGKRDTYEHILLCKYVYGVPTYIEHVVYAQLDSVCQDK